MNCPNCGNEVRIDDKFCTACGKRFEPVEPEKPSSAGVREKAMKLLGSPLFIIACILSVVSFLLTVVSWFTPNYAYLSSLLYSMGVPVSGMFGMANAVMTIVTIICNLPTIFEIIGVAILMFKAKSPHKNGGFVLIKIGLIMQIVWIAIIAAIVAIALIISLFAGAMSEVGEVFVAVLIATVLVVGLFIFAFAYMKGLLSAVSIAKDAVDDNKCVKKPSMFTVVVNFIGAVFSIFSSVFMLVGTLGIYGSNSFVSILTSMLPTFLNAVALIMFSIVMIQGRCLLDIARESKGYVPDYEKIPPIDMSDTRPITATKHCIYCGKIIRDGEICSCQIPAAPKAEEPVTFCTNCGRPLKAGETCDCLIPVEPEPAAPVTFCTNCGKQLREGEVCSCRTVAEKHFCTNCGKLLYGSQVCDCTKTSGGSVPASGTVSGGLRSTMRAPKNLTPEDTAARNEGQSYFGQGGDL